jgi:hypothetical protein
LVAATKGEGMSDHAWPADLAPSSLTLSALSEKHLLVRRGGVWHVRRNWQGILTHLASIAVPTPMLQMLDRPAPNLPTFAEMEVWQRICIWLDAQPKCRARLPFPQDLQTTADVLRGMRRYRLLRHTSACYWVLSPTWKTKLQNLWHGVLKQDGDAPPRDHQPSDPQSLVASLDTWYLNRLDKEMPTHLKMRLDTLQAEAKRQESDIETPWDYDSVPLRVFQSGVNASQGGGVSWAYILKNSSITILLRRKPLGGIVGQVRLGSECLWRLTPLEAYKQADHLIKTLWGNGKGEWQVSQAHLCHDVMNAPITLEQLDRYVSRSRTGALYEDRRRLLEAAGFDEDDLLSMGLTDADLYDMGDDAFAWGMEEDPDLEPDAVESREVTAYRWGRRLSGVAWSLRSVVGFVQYDKLLETRRTGKVHMHALWRAHGWTGTEPVTRHEARLRRAAFRSLRLPDGSHLSDDPLIFLTQLASVWAWVVGQSQDCPDATDVAWLRRVIPTEDSNRSRWPTDPAWRVVQNATFDAAPQEVRHLIRQEQQTTDVEKRIQALYGTLVSTAALENASGETWDISYAIRQVLPKLIEKSEEPGKDFGERVRERRKVLGLSVLPQRAIVPAFSPPETTGPSPEVLDTKPVDALDLAWWRTEMAERRMQEAALAVDQATAQHAPLPVIHQLDLARSHEQQVIEAALGHLDPGS